MVQYMVNYYNEETERYESDNYGRFQRFTSIYHAKNFIDKLVSKMPTFEVGDDIVLKNSIDIVKLDYRNPKKDAYKSA